MTEEKRPLPSNEGTRAEGTLVHHPPLHLGLFEQLKHRNVFRVAVLYLLACWLILDPVHVVFHMLEVPAWANRLVVMLMAVGFPLVLVFAWVYEITPEGLKPTHAVSHDASIRQVTARRLDRAIIAVLAVALAYLLLDKFWLSKHLAASAPGAVPAPATAVQRSLAPAAAFNPPPHSIAVLPFINLSGDQAQEYFSDGLTEELLNALADVNGLQVAARTSAFSFKGKDNDIGNIARKLNVAAILEGSVRRSAHTVRVTAQLINAVSGFHLWSKTYDRDLGDVLALQTEIANAVASALKVTLLGDEAAKIELGGTRNPAAFDAYLRAGKLMNAPHNAEDVQAAIDAFSEAIRLDPHYAQALAGRSLARSRFAVTYATEAAIPQAFAGALADAQQATALAPDLLDTHLATASLLARRSLDFRGADREYQRAITVAPGNARALSASGGYAVLMGRSDAGIAAVQRAIVLDPLNPSSRKALGDAFFWAHRYQESIAAYRGALVLDADYSGARGMLGLAYYELGDLESARSTCEVSQDSHWSTPLCLAVTLHRLGRPADAEAALAQLQATNGDSAAYQYAGIYAQWGDIAAGLKWLDTARRVRDPGLSLFKTDPLAEPLRREPRGQALLRELNLPD